MSPLRLVFMGTPDFAVAPLQSLAKAGHEIVAVYCQPPKPAGRGQQVKKVPVHNAAEALDLIVHTPRTLRESDAQKIFADLKPDIAVVAAYGLILPQAILDIPRLGCINIHASLLPRWRGAAPIQRAILAGDQETGVTLMQMEAGLDTGPMLRIAKCPITSETTAGSLHDTLMSLGADLIVPTLEDLAEGRLVTTPQPDEGVTYAAKLTREDGRLDWHKSASDLERQIRGLQPWPGCYFLLGKEPIKVLAAEITEKSGLPGTLLDDNFTIACLEKSLRLKTVQRAGKNATDGASLLRGLRLAPGSML